MADLINATLKEEMRRDDRIIVFGEDVADCSREGNLSEVKGKGGVFKLTAGLQTEFGGKRCFNTPIAEASIVGRAIGMATVGLQAGGGDSVLRLHLAGHDADSRRAGFAALALQRAFQRAPGDSRADRRLSHRRLDLSQPVRARYTFTHIPGLRVVFPSNAEDACGLLRTAIRCDDPVLFLEHKKLYREMYNRVAASG